jgi:DNA-binding MarR family transcriptional regulator
VCTSLRMATRVVVRHYDKALAPAGLKTSAYSILSRLDREGAQTIGSLAAGLAMDRTTLSREIAPLVQRALVDVRAGERDRRQKVLGLSGAGRARLKRARPLWSQAQADLADLFGLERTDGLMTELHDLVGAAA